MAEELDKLFAEAMVGSPLKGNRNEGYICHESMTSDACWYCGQPALGGIDHVPPVAFRKLYKKPWLLVRSCREDNLRLRDCDVIKLEGRKRFAAYLRNTQSSSPSWGRSGRGSPHNEKKAKNWLLKQLGLLPEDKEVPGPPYWGSTDKTKDK